MIDLFSIEAEQAALGALLVNNDVLPRFGELTPEHFYDPVHAEIYRVCTAIIADGRVATPVTLKPLVQDHPGLAQLGGPAYLIRLAGAAISLSSARDYADLIRQMWVRRTLSAACSEAQTYLYSSEEAAVEPIAARLEQRVASTLAAAGSAPSQSFRRSLTDAIREVNVVYSGEASVGVSSGLLALDVAINRLRPGRVYVLAARPSMGKSLVAWRIANSVAQTGAPVVFCSLEMQPIDLTNRALSMLLREQGAKVPYFRIERADLTEGEMRALIGVAREQEARPLYTVGPGYRDLSRLSLAVRTTARSLDKPVGLVVVDYLQLIQVAEARSVFDRVGAASKAMKWLSQDLGCPVLLLSQLNREVEQRDDKRPRLSDLRASGEIEEDADVVMMLYRPEYYLERASAGDDSKLIAKLAADRAAAKNRLEVLVTKNRSGPISTVRCYCEVEHNYVADEEREAAWQDAMDFA